MSFSHRLAFLAAVVVGPGCGQTHGVPEGDTAPVLDGGTIAPPGCRPGDPPPPASCVMITDRVCTDMGVALECDDGAWRCPVGTGDVSTCDCWADVPHGDDCTCTPEGWSCPDPCPDDLDAAAGTACDEDGRMCSTCWDGCSDCTELHCIGDTWEPVVVPGDPDCSTFLCHEGGDGSLSCGRYHVYCMGYEGAGGHAAGFGCYEVPPGCELDVCNCVELPKNAECTDDGNGRVRVVVRGG